ncbi:MAG: molecular chaperone [Candidatus Binatia bacterium]
MQSWRAYLALTAAGLGLLCSYQARPALGATFQVSPINLTLGPASPSTLLTITNQTTDVLRFQLSAFTWGQDDEGDPLLSDTEDIIFFPSLLSIPPGEQRNVRVGTAVPPAASEKTYRIFVEELPPMGAPEIKRSASVIRVLTRMGIPIFLQPGTIASGARITDMSVRDKSLSFVLRNTGNVHLVPVVQVRGVNAAGKATFQRETAGGYVLAGGQHTYTLELPVSERCATTGLVVAVRSEGTSVESKLDIGASACSSD